MEAAEAADRLCRIEPAAHHLVCRQCGTVADVDRVDGLAAYLEPASRAGYVIDEAEVTFRGLCAQCQDRGAP